MEGGGLVEEGAKTNSSIRIANAFLRFDAALRLQTREFVIQFRRVHTHTREE